MFKSAVIAIMIWLLTGPIVLAQSEATPAAPAEPTTVEPVVVPPVEAEPTAAAPVAAEAPQALPEVLSARISTTPERARVVLDLAGTTKFAIASLDGPNRIAIDVRASGLEFTDRTPVAGTGLVASYTIEMAESGRARALLTLSEPVQVQQAYVLEAFDDQPARLVVDLIPATPEQFANHVAADLAASTGAQTAALTQETEPGDTNLPQKTRPLVVIDPGHGGIDSGARANGIMEKDVVLAFALRLQEILVQSGRFDVALTREDDSFLKLEERVALARRNKADLFISIHADSFQQPEIRGASVYTRDEKATDVLDKVLADQENTRDLIAGFSVPSEMADSVVDILVDLMRREMRIQSFMAAQDIVRQLEPSVALRPFPVRQADFFVLQAPDVPSVLLELGFLSNAGDIKNLMEGGWRDRTAEALARGISTYFDEIDASGSVVATQ